MTARPVSLRERNRSTLARQGLLRRFTGAVPAAIGRLAGLQAQHADMPYIALWSRLAGFERSALQTALEERMVVRATLMRSTLHLVAASDFAMFDGAVRGARLANFGSIARKAGVDLAALHEALLAFCSEPRTVDEMEAHLDGVLPETTLRPQVPAGVRRAAFRLGSAGGGLVHVPPSGYWGQHGRPRYIDARVWVGDDGRAAGGPGEDPTVIATSTAMERYLSAYGPATMADIAKWLGQPRIGVMRAAVEMLGDRLVDRTGDDGAALLDLAGSDIPDADRPAPPRFLSRWDSVLIGYDARDRILPPRHRAAVVKKNGDFLPTFLIDGWVAGLWSVTTAKGTARIRLGPFEAVPGSEASALEAEGDRLVRFIAPEAGDWVVELLQP